MVASGGGLPLGLPSLPFYRLRPSVLPREVEPGKKVVSPSNSKFSIGRTGRASSIGKQGRLCAATDGHWIGDVSP